MELNVYVHLILLCVVNIILTFSGIVLNTLVIAIFWKASQLRNKLCHFMIMVLSCFDLLAVITNHSGMMLLLIFWLTEDYDLLLKMRAYLDFVRVFVAFSFDILLVMSIERYLGAYFPIFHRTSVTRRKLLTPLAILFIVHTTLFKISANDMIISKTLVTKICIIIILSPLLYLNFKLFKFSREMRRRKEKCPEKRTTIDLKSISTCFLVVACLVLLTILGSVYIVFNINTENKRETNVKLSRIWTGTVFTMNCTFNSLIFFWKNKILRAEGIKILKSLKGRLVGS